MLRLSPLLASSWLCFLKTAILCHAQRQHTDNIFFETVWTMEDSAVVQIVQDIFVLETGSLTVEPGVQIEFTGPFSIFVRGSVLLNGSPEAPIRVSNGYKAFSLMDEVLDASLTATHTIFENNSGGAIMREWPSSGLGVPPITVTDCTFINNEYAVRSYDAVVSHSVITGGRIGASLHRSNLVNVTVRDSQEICIFAGTDSFVTDCTLQNCGAVGLQIEGIAEGVHVTQAEQGIAAVLDGWGSNALYSRAKDCVLEEISGIGLKHMALVEDTIVSNSPNAVGVVMDTGLLTRSVVTGTRVGVATGAVEGEEGETNIEDSYVCGNSEAQFYAKDYFGNSNASRTRFGDTAAASNDELMDMLQALPFMPSAKGILNYDITDSTVQNMGFDLQVQAIQGCGITDSSPTASPTTTPTLAPTKSPTAPPTTSPTKSPTPSPTGKPTTRAPTTPAPTPPPTFPQAKVAPLAAKCGSVATSNGRGGAAGESKGCTRGVPARGPKRKIRGL